MPEQVSRFVVGKIDVTNGSPKNKVVGYLGYYRTHKNVEKTVYMSVQEVHEHAKQWAPEAYNSDYGAWKDPKKLPIMEMKTVFIQLTKTMDLSGQENEKLRKALEIENNGDVIDAPAEDLPEPEKVSVVMTLEQARVVTFLSPIGVVEMGTLEGEQLNIIYLADMSTDEQKQAAVLILKHDFNREPPEKPKATEAELKQQLGF